MRRARQGDLDGLLALLSQLAEEPIARTPAHEAAFARILAAPGRAILLAEEGGGPPLGTLDLVLVEDLADGGRPWCALENVVVDDARRRGGVGRALMDAAVAIAEEAGAGAIQLVSSAHRSEAHAFYAACGFTVPVRGFRMLLALRRPPGAQGRDPATSG